MAVSFAFWALSTVLSTAGLGGGGGGGLFDCAGGVDYEPAQRIYGSTTWNLHSLIGLSVEGLTSFSVAPLRLASLLGVLLAGVAFVFGVQILIETVVFGESVPPAWTRGSLRRHAPRRRQPSAAML